MKLYLSLPVEFHLLLCHLLFEFVALRQRILASAFEYRGRYLDVLVLTNSRRIASIVIQTMLGLRVCITLCLHPARLNAWLVHCGLASSLRRAARLIGLLDAVNGQL